MYQYVLIRSRRRTAVLEITRKCEVVVRAPLKLPRRVIDAFVSSHESWITDHLARQRKRLETAPPPPTQEEIAALKTQARKVLLPKVAYYSLLMGLTPTGIKITAARSRFGSCSGKNSLCFSCFLMDSPDDAIDLVVVHELAHIRWKNHGSEFYELLGKILPDWKERKKLLKIR